DSFMFKVADSHECDSSSVTVGINAVCPTNHCPTAKVTLLQPCTVPNLPVLLVVSVNGSNGCAAFDASMSMDPDGDPLTFKWYLDGAATPFAMGRIVTNCFDFGVHTVTLVVDDGTCTASDSVQFEVDSACVAVEALINDVNNSALSRKEKRPLIDTLKHAC